jgi:hypothetical protein
VKIPYIKKSTVFWGIPLDSYILAGIRPEYVGECKGLNIDIMAVLCPSHLIMWEERIPDQLPISEDVHPPVPQLCGCSGHFYKSQEVIQIRIRHFKI